MGVRTAFSSIKHSSWLIKLQRRPFISIREKALNFSTIFRIWGIFNVQIYRILKLKTISIISVKHNGEAWRGAAQPKILLMSV